LIHIAASFLTFACAKKADMMSSCPFGRFDLFLLHQHPLVNVVCQLLTNTFFSPLGPVSRSPGSPTFSKFASIECRFVSWPASLAIYPGLPLDLPNHPLRDDSPPPVDHNEHLLLQRKQCNIKAKHVNCLCTLGSSIISKMTLPESLA
jgi:hypothetical protein